MFSSVWERAGALSSVWERLGPPGSVWGRFLASNVFSTAECNAKVYGIMIKDSGLRVTVANHTPSVNPEGVNP